MKQRKTLIKMIMLVVMTAVLPGCWDQHEIDEKAYVIAIGLDEHEAEGKVKVTYLIANPEVGSQQTGGSSNSESPEEIITVIADDFISSRNIANAVTSKIISYDLLKVMVISEDLASDQNFIRWIYDAAKDREIKRSANLIVSKEKAYQFIQENRPKLETRPHKYFELKIDRGQETGMIPDTDLNGFFRVTESDADFFLAIYATTEEVGNQTQKTEDDLMAGELKVRGKTNVTQFIGSAVFKQGVMVGKITGEETRISSLLDTTWDTRDILTTFQDPFDERYRISARISQNRKNKYNLIKKSDPPVIEINVPLFIDVLSDPSMSNYLKNKEKVKILKKSMTENVEKKMNEYIERTQQEFKGETFHLSVPIRKEFSTLREFRDFDWMKSYPDAEIRLKVDIDFGEFGRQTKLPSLQEVRD